MVRHDVVLSNLTGWQEQTCNFRTAIAARLPSSSPPVPFLPSVDGRLPRQVCIGEPLSRSHRERFHEPSSSFRWLNRNGCASWHRREQRVRPSRNCRKESSALPTRRGDALCHTHDRTSHRNGTIREVLPSTFHSLHFSRVYRGGIPRRGGPPPGGVRAWGRRRGPDRRPSFLVTNASIFLRCAGMGLTFSTSTKK